MCSPFLETERLVLRRFTFDDVDLFHELISDERINKFNYYPDTSREFVINSLNNLIKDYDENLYEAWVIERKEDHEPLGKISVTKVFTRFNYVEVGYTVRYDYWGNSYAPEALSRITDYLLNEKKYRLVECVIDDRNTRSLRVAEKAGFIKDGHIDNRRPNDDGTYSGISYFSKELKK